MFVFAVVHLHQHDIQLVEQGPFARKRRLVGRHLDDEVGQVALDALAVLQGKGAPLVPTGILQDLKRKEPRLCARRAFKDISDARPGIWMFFKGRQYLLSSDSLWWKKKRAKKIRSGMLSNAITYTI